MKKALVEEWTAAIICMLAWRQRKVFVWFRHYISFVTFLSRRWDLPFHHYQPRVSARGMGFQMADTRRLSSERAGGVSSGNEIRKRAVHPSEEKLSRGRSRSSDSTFPASGP